MTTGLLKTADEKFNYISAHFEQMFHFLPNKINRKTSA